jgi:hypothetical protein
MPIDIEIKSRPPRILLIGDNMWNPCRAYARAFRQWGYNVFHVGRGAPDIDLAHLPNRNMQYNGPFGRHQTQVRIFKLKSLLDCIGLDFDLIFHIQDWTLPSGTSPVPYFFYCTEAMLPVCPQPTTFALGATDAMKRIIRRDYPNIRTLGYLPHCVPGVMPKNAVFPENPRPIKASFAGEIYALYEAYAQRRKIVQTLKQDMPGFEGHWLGESFDEKNRIIPPDQRRVEAGQGRLGPDPYVKLLMNSKVGLNIPTAAGANFRDVEVPSLGAMLVTLQTPDHYLMGFRDGINCRFFDGTPEDAIAKCNNYSEEIARKGWELVVKGYQWKDPDGVEWNCEGHTILPRMRQLGIFFQKFVGVTPPEWQPIEDLKEKEKDVPKTDKNNSS